MDLIPVPDTFGTGYLIGMTFAGMNAKKKRNTV